jgi:7-cyano-7-deazaguanine synthase in queuosine biosynthesis
MRYECGPEWDTRIITINPKHFKVGILMSGGIDSWVLFNIIKQVIPEIIIFNIKRADKYDGAERIKLLTGRNEIIEIDELTTNHADRIPMGMDYILDNYDIDELYTGANIIPHTEYFPEFITDERPGRRWSIPSWIKIKCPFLHLYKYHIIDLANRNNIDLSQTQSCLHQLKEHCGKCWQCLERQWGYKQLKI